MLNILISPELHLIIGECWVDIYLKMVHIVRKSYQGAHVLEGNQSSMFLKKLPQLEQAIMQESDQMKILGLPLLESLKCFSKVQDAYFRPDLKEGFEKCIQQFSLVQKPGQYEHHLQDPFFRGIGEKNHGLGWYSEHAS